MQVELEKEEAVVPTEFNTYTKNKRESNIDLIKTVLVLGMIFSHILDFFFDKHFLITNYINLVSFSGFIFVFGYNAYNAYIKKEETNIKKIIKNIFKLILVFYVSGFFYDFFIQRNHKISNYINILCFLRLPGYSEFLATFALLYLFILVFRNRLRKISQKNNYILICIVVSLLFTIIPPVAIYIPWINLILKTRSISFPLLPYLNLFFIGMYIAKNKPKFNVRMLLILFIMWYIHLIMFLYNLERRFPVSLSYIIGSYLYLFLYYHISTYVCMKIKSEKSKKILTVVRKKQFDFFVD